MIEDVIGARKHSSATLRNPKLQSFIALAKSGMDIMVFGVVTNSETWEFKKDGIPRNV